MSTKEKLAQLKVISPCTENWDSMAGNDRVRFCSHCSLHVQDISAMTSQRALKLALDSRGRLCVRYVSDDDSNPLTNLSRKARRLGRRTSQLAAGAFSAALTMATAAAQSGAVHTPAQDQAVIVQPPQWTASPSAPAAGDSKPKRVGIMGRIAVRMPSEPLVLAAFKDDLPGLTQLVYRGADVNVQDKAMRISALSLAVEHGNREMVQLLLRSGARVNQSGDQNGVLMYLRDTATPELVLDLISAGAQANESDESGDTPLLHAAGASNLAVIKVLINSGARVDVVDEGGETPLMRAAANEDSSVVRFLLQLGVDVNARDKDGGNALTVAAGDGNLETVRLLLNAGVELEARDTNGQTPLMLAAGRDQTDLLQALIDAGAEINAVDSEGETALMVAAGNAPVESVRLLLEAGARVGDRDKDGETALMQAAGSGDADCVKLLIKAGAAISDRNNEGKTALDLAREDKSEEVIKVLKAHGARR